MGDPFSHLTYLVAEKANSYLLRATPAMGTLLAIHLGFVLALFITMPYGKLVHTVYRYAALVKNAMEQARE